MTAMKIKIKEEPPDEDLSAILDNGILLSSVDKEAEGLITQQIEEILPNDEDEEEEEEEEEEEVKDNEEEPKKKKRRLPCRYCDFKAKTKKELGRHEARHAIKGWYHECRYCDYVTYIRQRLQEHESKHTNTKPFKCDKCEFKTRFKADLYKHRAKHSTVKKFSCPKCDFRTKWCRNIKHHLLKHTEERPHACEICGFRFKRIQDLKYHLYRHNDVKPIQCEVCEFRCKTNYELKCHRLKHSDVKNFSCTFPGCTQKTKTKSDLTKHIRTHNKDNSYLCSMCGKGFNTLTSLNKHKDRHSNIRKFKCALCEKWFKNKPSLRAHMKIHSGIKPFQCDVCLRYFLNKYNMHKHKETHTGDRPYLCPICPYGARISDHLLAHIGSMHGDSHAYFCELCRKPFKRYSQLQVHIKRMHKHVKNFDRDGDGKLDIKLESGADGIISTGNDVFSVKKIVDCHFEPEVKRKRGRPPKNKPPVSVEPLSETVGENSDPQLLKPTRIKKELTSGDSVIKLATYQDGFRLPLATKGFQFNFDKTGKKPRSWFMQPENMHGKAAVKQRAYIAKKERYFDRLNSGRIQRVRKKSDAVYSGLNMITRATAQKVCGATGSDTQQSLLAKESEPHRLLISGRTKLKTMRKIKRRIRHMKASLKGSALLNDPVQTQSNDVRSELGNGNSINNGITGEIVKSEDEDDVPLSQLRTMDSKRLSRLTKSVSFLSKPDSAKNRIDCSNAGSQLPVDSYPSNSNDRGTENGHIKLVLKRRKEGTFKVTLNTSTHVPNPTPVQTEVIENKMSNLASDIYNGSVRILCKSLQAKLNNSPVKSNRIKKSNVKRKAGTKTTICVIKKKKPKKSAVNQRSPKQKPMKEKTCVNAIEKKKIQKTSKVVKGKQKQKQNKSKKKDVTQSRSPQKVMNGKGKKVPQKSATSRGKAKSKCTKPRSAQTKPKSKKKNLICSIGSSKSPSKKAQNTSDRCSRKRRFLQNETVEDFPIKIEPVDDEYESSLKSPMSGALLDVSSLVKSECFSETVDHHLPNCPGSSICSCAASIVEKEYTEEWEPQCRYLYDVKPDVNVDQSYNEHAIAWGLNLDSQCENENLDRNENLKQKLPSSDCTGKKHVQQTFPSEIDDSGVVLARSDLVAMNVEDRTSGETNVTKSVYCWETSNHQTNGKDSVLAHAVNGLLESYPLDLSLNRKFELCDEESSDKGLIDTSSTQDKIDKESVLQCPISYTYTF